MARTLTVWWEGAVVGALSANREGAMRFAYAESWLADRELPPLSQSLPKRPEPFRPRQCRPFFEGLLPEGAQRDAVAAAACTSAANDFRLLECLGGEVAGALSLWQSGEAPPQALAEPAKALSSTELVDLLNDIESRPFLVGEGKRRLSLAGAQSKLPMVMKEGRVALSSPGQPTTHILKPPMADLAATTENEAFAMRLAASLGLAVAQVEAFAVAPGRTCLLVTRYDRAIGPDGTVRRLHQEDFCQALGILSSRKYAADGGPDFRRCFELVRRACAKPAVEALKLMDAAIFQVLIGNADAHGKNYSLLYADGGMQLAPLYDLLSTRAYPSLHPRFAMRIAGRTRLREFRSGDWSRFAKNVGFGAPIVRRRVEELANLALERAEAVAGELSGLGLEQQALAGFAEQVMGRARRLRSTLPP